LSQRAHPFSDARNVQKLSHAKTCAQMLISFANNNRNGNMRKRAQIARYRVEAGNFLFDLGASGYLGHRIKVMQ
jgi:hypothetical protein